MAEASSFKSFARWPLHRPKTLRRRVGAQGHLGTALHYLDLAPGEGVVDTAVLRDRIYRAGGPQLAASVQAPPFPFIAEDVTDTPIGANSILCPLPRMLMHQGARTDVACMHCWSRCVAPAATICRGTRCNYRRSEFYWCAPHYWLVGGGRAGAANGTQYGLQGGGSGGAHYSASQHQQAYQVLRRASAANAMHSLSWPGAAKRARECAVNIICN